MKKQSQSPSDGAPVSGETSRPRFWAYEGGKLWVKDFGDPSLFATRSKLTIDVAFREVRKSEIAPLSAAMGITNTKEVSNRLESGRRCFAAWFHDQIVAYCWVSRIAECVGEIEHAIHFKPDEAYIWDCATLPEYRHRGIYSGLLAFMASTLARDGISRVWIGSSLDNTPSLRGFANAGYSEVATLIYFRLFQYSVMLVLGVRSTTGNKVASARRILTSEWPHIFGPVAFGKVHGYRFASEIRSPCSDNA